MLSNNIWPVLTDFREKKQLFIDSSFTLLTVSFLTSWDVKVVIYDLLLPDPVRKATSSRSSLRYIASPPFISFIEQPLCLGRALSHHRPQLLFSVQSLCSLERNWVACFISFPRIFVPTISSPQENDTSSKLKIFHQIKDYMSASNLPSAAKWSSQTLAISPLHLNNPNNFWQCHCQGSAGSWGSLLVLVSVGCSSYRFLDHSAGQGSGNGIETRISRITGTPDLVSVLGRSRYRFSDQPAGRTQQRERIGGGEAEERPLQGEDTGPAAAGPSSYLPPVPVTTNKPEHIGRPDIMDPNPCFDQKKQETISHGQGNYHREHIHIDIGSLNWLIQVHASTNAERESVEKNTLD